MKKFYVGLIIAATLQISNSRADVWRCQNNDNDLKDRLNISSYIHTDGHKIKVINFKLELGSFNLITALEPKMPLVPSAGLLTLESPRDKNGKSHTAANLFLPFDQSKISEADLFSAKFVVDYRNVWFGQNNDGEDLGSIVTADLNCSRL